MRTGINSRAKGAGGEREFSAELANHIGVRLTRNLEQSRQGGHDLTLPADAPEGPATDALGRLAIECKRHATVTPGALAGWWDQARGQAERVGLWPALAYRGDRQGWRVRLPLAALWDNFGAWSDDPWTVDLSLLGFAAVLREGLVLPCGDR